MGAIVVSRPPPPKTPRAVYVLTMFVWDRLVKRKPYRRIGIEEQSIVKRTYRSERSQVNEK